ncbi:MAG: hypothetical protein LUG50_02670 [Planctomycetaceae bacterium]|nr:hypothetical protein [Planctomycetaceae bacterium]
MYICQICKKVPATIHLTDIHNNVKKEVHICESCAAEKGFNLQGAANLPQLLGLAAKKPSPGGGIAVPGKAVVRPKIIDKDLVCDRCGMSWSQFGERGRLGCPHDYTAFAAKLKPLIENQIAAERPAGGPFHVGKHPGANAMKGDQEKVVRMLRKKLRAAVAEENYEAAAMLKSKIDAFNPEPAGENQTPATGDHMKEGTDSQ